MKKDQKKEYELVYYTDVTSQGEVAFSATDEEIDRIIKQFKGDVPVRIGNYCFSKDAIRLIRPKQNYE